MEHLLILNCKSHKIIIKQDRYISIFNFSMFIIPPANKFLDILIDLNFRMLFAKSNKYDNGLIVPVVKNTNFRYLLNKGHDK